MRPTVAYKHKHDATSEPLDTADVLVDKALNEFGHTKQSFNRNPVQGTTGFGLAAKEVPVKASEQVKEQLKELTRPEVSDRLLLATRASSLNAFQDEQRAQMAAEKAAAEEAARLRRVRVVSSDSEFLRPTTAFVKHKTVDPEPDSTADSLVAQSLNDFGHLRSFTNKSGTAGFGLGVKKDEISNVAAVSVRGGPTVPTVSERLLTTTKAAKLHGYVAYKTHRKKLMTKTPPKKRHYANIESAVYTQKTRAMIPATKARSPVIAQKRRQSLASRLYSWGDNPIPKSLKEKRESLPANMTATTMMASAQRPASVKTKRWSMEPVIRRKQASPVKATESTPLASHSRPARTSPIAVASKAASPSQNMQASPSPEAQGNMEGASPQTMSQLSAKKSSAKKASPHPPSRNASATKIAHKSPFIGSAKRRKSIGSASRVRTPVAMAPSPVTPEVYSEEQQHLSAHISPVQDALAQEVNDEHDDEPESEAVVEEEERDVVDEPVEEEAPTEEAEAEMSLEEEEEALMEMISSAVDEETVDSALSNATLRYEKEKDVSWSKRGATPVEAPEPTQELHPSEDATRQEETEEEEEEVEEEKEEEKEEEVEPVSPPPTEISGLASLLQPTEALRILEQETSIVHEKEAELPEGDHTFQVEEVIRKTAVKSTKKSTPRSKAGTPRGYKKSIRSPATPKTPTLPLAFEAVASKSSAGKGSIGKRPKSSKKSAKKLTPVREVHNSTVHHHHGIDVDNLTAEIAHLLVDSPIVPVVDKAMRDASMLTPPSPNDTMSRALTSAANDGAINLSEVVQAEETSANASKRSAMQRNSLAATPTDRRRTIVPEFAESPLTPTFVQTRVSARLAEKAASKSPCSGNKRASVSLRKSPRSASKK